MTFDPRKAVIIRHMYYHDSGKLDLQKMRADAHRLAQGDKYNPPEVVLLHHHAKESRCGLAHVDVPEQHHEEFRQNVEEEVKSD